MPINYDKTEFVMHDDGSFHIEVDGIKGNYTVYSGISCLTIGERVFIGVSAFYEGGIPIECVLEVKTVSEEVQL